LGSRFQSTSPSLAVLSSKELPMAKVCQGSDRSRDHEGNIPSPAAITTVGRPSRFKTQAFKTDTAGATMAGLHQYFGFIGKVPTRQSKYSYSFG
jgi:hypothetical protein